MGRSSAGQTGTTLNTAATQIPLSTGDNRNINDDNDDNRNIDYNNNDNNNYDNNNNQNFNQKQNEKNLNNDFSYSENNGFDNNGFGEDGFSTYDYGDMTDSFTQRNSGGKR